MSDWTLERVAFGTLQLSHVKNALCAAARSSRRKRSAKLSHTKLARLHLQVTHALTTTTPPLAPPLRTISTTASHPQTTSKTQYQHTKLSPLEARSKPARTSTSFPYRFCQSEHRTACKTQDHKCDSAYYSQPYDRLSRPRNRSHAPHTGHVLGATTQPIGFEPR